MDLKAPSKCLLFFLLFLSTFSSLGMADIAAAVRLIIEDDRVVVDNGILQLTLSNPGGIVAGIKYGGIDNLVELHNQNLNGGFWDLNWSPKGITKTKGQFDMIEATNFTVVVENEDQVEISFMRVWDPSLQGKQSPLNIDKRFIVLRGCSGFYSYAIFEHLENMPAFNLNTTRIAFMLNKDKFHYMVIADNRRRHMPSPDDRMPDRGQELAYPEAVLLVNPMEPEFKGEVDDKYQYSCDNKDSRVHGWISFDPPVGFWQIKPSNEFRTGGPFKQDLTSHVNPTTLAIFVTSHYAGEDLVVKLEAGEIWKKVFGPVFIYLNSETERSKALSLWDDAKEQMEIETRSWPYDFPKSEDFPCSDQRGTVSGRLLVQDRYASDEHVAGKGSYVGLAPPGDAGSWQRECKGYQFWGTADEEGYFTLENIREGEYNLFASVPGFIGDYRYNATITISPGLKFKQHRNILLGGYSDVFVGCDIHTGDLVFEPPRDGPTLWEIGVPDRSAAEFYVPDPNPLYVNKLYVNHPDRFRQYGLWERYGELYPDKDLEYTVGVSDYKKDWFFAQVTRKIGNNSYEGSTWKINFNLGNIHHNGTCKLRVALAAAHFSDLQIRVNDEAADLPLFSSGTIGSDNAIARHGIHGLYWLFSVDVPSSRLILGNNTIFLTQSRHSSPFQGIMYDYIRLESPPAVGTLKNT